VSDIETLSQALLPGSVSFTIDPETDGLTAITQLLATTGAKYLAIVAHGEPGVVHLGENSLKIEQLQAQSQLLSAWGVKEIALYSCEVAKGDIGKGLIYQLSELTGATVAASAIKTGNQTLGGSWDLAVATGEIAAPKLFEAKILQTYQSVLAVSFSSVNTYPLGINPYSTRTADLNGDGFDDIFSGNSTPNNTIGSISVLLSNGTGGFLPATTYVAGIDPFSVVALDVNADGKLDLVASNGGYGTLSGTGTVSVLLNTGKGIFGTATPLGLGVTTDTVSYPFGGGGLIIAYNPNSPRVGDFNNDDIPDLLVVDAGYNRTVVRTPSSPPVDPDPASRVSVFLSGKDGFSAPIVSPASVLASVATLGDFNNDGNLDVVTRNYKKGKSNDISLMLGDGKGSFISPITFSDPYIIADSSLTYVRTGDFNNDGNLDIVATNGDNTISVLLGNGRTVGFSAAASFTTGNKADNLVVEDVNGDGKLDVTTNSASTNTISILLGDGVGGFGIPTILAVGSSPQQVSIGNFNGDSKPDLVTGNQDSQDVSVLLNNTISSNVARNDFNNDGKSDILWRNDYGSVALWQMNGATVTSGNLTSAPDLDPSWKVAGTGDFNGDGKPDILWRNTSGAVVVWTMDGATVKSSTATSTPTLDNSWTTAGTGDYNGDGKADILWRNTNGAVVVWTMDGATIKSSTATSTPTLDSSWKVAGNSDFNGDGKADILWRNDDGSVALWQMNGAAITSSTAIAKLSTDWKIAGTGDFNGDGKADILWRNDDGRVVLWQMNNTAITSSSLTSTPSRDSSQTIAGIGDYNGDGKADILWRKDTGATEVWQMNSATVVSSTLTSVAADSTNWKIAAPII
jgi:hypothetical protein